MIIRKQYMRDANRNKIGVMVAIKDDKEIYFGFSKCNTMKDSFSKTIGTEIAIGRAKKHHKSNVYEVMSLLPDSARGQFMEFASLTVARNPSYDFPKWVSDLGL